jgi:hypothetical protein
MSASSHHTDRRLGGALVHAHDRPGACEAWALYGRHAPLQEGFSLPAGTRVMARDHRGT